MHTYRLPDDTLAICFARLIEILNTIPRQLRSIPTETFDRSPGEGKWSPKQIIGHLIDSAANNHQRFVRGQFEDRPLISYDQEKWNTFSYYEKMDGRALIDFWEMYNFHISNIIAKIPDALLQRECTMSDGSCWSLSSLFEDYVRHLEHHLRQIGL